MTYPNQLETLRTDIAAGESMQTANHAGLHNQVDRVVNSIQAVLGTEPPDVVLLFENSLT